MKGFNDFGPRSLDLEVLGLRLCRGLLGHGQRQDAVFIGGLDALDVDLGHVETSRVRTVVTLAANVIALVVLFALAVLVLGMDGQNVIVDVDVDVFLAEAAVSEMSVRNGLTCWSPQKFFSICSSSRNGL